ncbi:cytosol leucyl aminopeptidase [Artemisia annua]|uniref:Cytosol leucyl aminopeptidase n=1 Tax=Artemisia annua TaxID=35608 RepID=A0A2U1NMI4_ARTAN|nr:cytosol leucyl aminopeptidase [Artemisia annua]
MYHGIEVHFLVAAYENIISGTRMGPSDIVTASNGKTIEVYVCTWQYERVVSKALVDRIPDEKASTTTTLKLYYATSSIVHQLEVLQMV